MKYLFSLLIFVFKLATIASAADPQPLAIGSPAPDFNLRGVDGKSHRLSDFSSSSVLVVIFTCNHCPTAQAYEERIKQLVTDYKSRGVAVVAISPNDPQSIRLDELGYTDLSDGFEEMKIRAKDKAFNFPYLYDGENSQVSMKYGPQATPHAFVFDKDRKLRYTGRIDDGEKPGTAKVHDTRNAIDALLANKPVTVEKTKTFGCSIKWPSKRDFANAATDEFAKEKVNIDELTLDQLKAILANKTVNYRLINVWATWCGPCVAEFPEFVNMNRMYRNREFELITISLDDLQRKQNALNFLTKKQASSKNYILNGDRYAFIESLDKKWEGSLPYTMFIAPDGKILYSKQGVIEPLEIKKLIAESLGRIY
ncbi:redoxin family protein [Chryseosolibacter indicus]|uniref:Redoxin domain-containing protein n=1 Tax=Chryseosolibacter indicus TaxID=2782351 RepID=A0ABS5VN87_9BACT|nr:redoxin family protein [Chryseosolibacter indicus]MBT1702912.1 redoxin domain-containing protein [Chryseosolibacter indicus]